MITDKFSREIQGYHVADNLKTEGCLKALEMAQKKLPKGEQPTHHSDRGCQYASQAYQARLKRLGMPLSMTEKDHCAQNALAERMNGILKQEYELDGRFRSKEQAVEAVKQAVWLYNEKRPHGALNNQTPAERRRQIRAARGASWRPAPLQLAPRASTPLAAKK